MEQDLRSKISFNEKEINDLRSNAAYKEKEGVRLENRAKYESANSEKKHIKEIKSLSKHMKKEIGRRDDSITRLSNAQLTEKKVVNNVSASLNAICAFSLSFRN